MVKDSRTFCEYCEHGKSHPIYVFVATSEGYERVARSRNPLKAVEEFKATKGFQRAKGFPRRVKRSQWRLRMFFGPFPTGVAARRFKHAWEHGTPSDMQEVQKEFNAECFEVQYES